MENPNISGCITSEGNMVNFARKLPLYDSLAAKLTERIHTGTIQVNTEFKAKLNTILNSLDSSRTIEVALLLIHHHFLNHPDVNPFNLANCNYKNGKHGSNLPFGIRVSSGGIGFHFDLEALNPSFQGLLGIYCSL